MLGLHYLTDVLAAIVLGITIGLLMVNIIPTVIQLTPLKALLAGGTGF
jgi:membrane-associated phospholipid phosphatase